MPRKSCIQKCICEPRCLTYSFCFLFIINASVPSLHRKCASLGSFIIIGGCTISNTCTV